MLGMTNRTLYKWCKGTVDKRSHGFQNMHRSPKQAIVVVNFFCELYWSAAERLPEVFDDIEDVDKTIEQNITPQGSSSPVDDILMLDWKPNISAMDVVSNITRMEDNPLPVRHLQHGKLGDLWWQFIAWHHACSSAWGY